MKFWAGLGSQGCRENKTPKCHKYAPFLAFGWFFQLFVGKKKWKHCSIRTVKLHRKKVKKIYFWGKFFIFYSFL